MWAREKYWDGMMEECRSIVEGMRGPRTYTKYKCLDFISNWEIERRRRMLDCLRHQYSMYIGAFRLALLEKIRECRR